MKYAIAAEHRHFFEKQRHIEFEALLSPEEVTRCNEAIDEVLCKRLHLQQSALFFQSPEQQFMAGRDLWRCHSFLKKVVHNRSFAEIASELFFCSPMRLAYDQLILCGKESKDSFLEEKTSKPKEMSSYVKMMQSKSTLQEISSIQGVIGGVVIALSDRKEEQSDGSAPHLFPLQAGCGSYFSAELPLPFAKLESPKKERYLLIVYTRKVSVYVMQKEDPHRNDLKQWGYQFGDPLSLKTHPLLFSHAR